MTTTWKLFGNSQSTAVAPELRPCVTMGAKIASCSSLQSFCPHRALQGHNRSATSKRQISKQLLSAQPVSVWVCHGAKSDRKSRTG
ncbi:MAG: hypothetical protein BECKG1743D_GA0114223_102043 [Candidatus Kentron sp. G]|nr:MAG: hypothetical protein BECKG1743E_GA0114224_102192 [Candidatus Kentron sp. G]VFN00536.1 MAG: hypothetical protein BECKG1743D_GA0114223_102043 [Candidatus Kentron sp. G]